MNEFIRAHEDEIFPSVGEQSWAMFKLNFRLALYNVVVRNFDVINFQIVYARNKKIDCEIFKSNMPENKKTWLLFWLIILFVGKFLSASDRCEKEKKREKIK